jgi:hypothetical protein
LGRVAILCACAPCDSRTDTGRPRSVHLAHIVLPRPSARLWSRCPKTSSWARVVAPAAAARPHVARPSEQRMDHAGECPGGLVLRECGVAWREKDRPLAGPFQCAAWTPSAVRATVGVRREQPGAVARLRRVDAERTVRLHRGNGGGQLGVVRTLGPVAVFVRSMGWSSSSLRTAYAPCSPEIQVEYLAGDAAPIVLAQSFDDQCPPTVRPKVIKNIAEWLSQITPGQSLG